MGLIFLELDYTASNAVATDAQPSGIEVAMLSLV